MRKTFTGPDLNCCTICHRPLSAHDCEHGQRCPRVGLSVEVFRCNLGDCTNGGVSSKFNSFVLTGTNPLNGKEVTGPCSPSPECPELVLVPGPLKSVRAVPRNLLESGAWVMFGGNFVWCCDSRFPWDFPIKVFDRVETAEQSRQLSI